MPSETSESVSLDLFFVGQSYDIIGRYCGIRLGISQETPASDNLHQNTIEKILHLKIKVWLQLYFLFDSFNIINI